MTHNFQCQGTSDWTTSILAHGVSRLSGFHTWSRPDSQPLCPFFTHPCCTSVLCHLGGRIRTGSHAHGGAAQVSLWEEHSLRELIDNLFHFIWFFLKVFTPLGYFHFFPRWFWLIWFSFVVANTQMHNEKLCNHKPVKCCHGHFFFFFFLRTAWAVRLCMSQRCYVNVPKVLRPSMQKETTEPKMSKFDFDSFTTTITKWKRELLKYYLHFIHKQSAASVVISEELLTT